jgi:serine/threonine protein kinase
MMLKPLAKIGRSTSYTTRYSPGTPDPERDVDSPFSTSSALTHRAHYRPKEIETIVGHFEDHYKVLGLVHDGGEQCRIKRVQCKEDKKEYVIKIQLKKKIRSRDDELFRRITTRIMNMTEIDNIVQIHRCFEDADYYYTLMESCDGGNLCNFLKLYLCDEMDDETYENEVREVMREVLLSLQHLHKMGIVHKDVKLDNFVFKNRGALTPRTAAQPKSRAVATEEVASVGRQPSGLKLIDFDFTNVFDLSRRCKDVVGTDGYIAPEAYRGVVGPKGDVFSAGVMMYTLIARRFPYHGDMFDDGPNENWVGHPKMKEIHEKLRDCKVRFGRSWKYLDLAKDFCMALLEFDSEKRLSTEEALNHPWIAKFEEKTKPVEAMVPAKFGSFPGTKKKQDTRKGNNENSLSLPVL